MPSYGRHLTAYAALIVAVSFTLHRVHLLEDVNAVTYWSGVFVGAVYTLVPDLDTPSSKIRRISERIVLAAVAVTLGVYLAGYADRLVVYVALVLVALLYCLWYTKHRGVLHTAGAAVLLSAPLALINPVYAVFGLTGYLLHLLLG